uniref:Uncharacterized protein n=1 Tax=Siphoviridae sp. ctLkp13 TaxID=2826252 RepID=A0A8S5LTA0_9CAUD|nr:MAG TPA: hypothetical protein [Siphoviridae sp. ctLkp13]
MTPNFEYFFKHLFANCIFIVNLSTHHVFASNRVNSPHQYPYHLLNHLACLSWISSRKTNIRDHPAGFKPDLKSRKPFIYKLFYP